jgi:hypothetical protein
VIAALLLSLVAIGAFWLVVYDATPVVALIVVAEASIVIALAFGVGSRRASRGIQERLGGE